MGSQTMPEMQGHMPPGYCLKERKRGGLGDQPPRLLLGLQALGVIGLGSSAQHHPGTYPAEV